MNCPWCGKEMLHGNLTGNKLLRLVPDTDPPKQTQRYERNLPPSQYETGLEGIYLDVPYAGLAPWIPADFCRDCRRVVFEADVLQSGGGDRK